MEARNKPALGGLPGLRTDGRKVQHVDALDVFVRQVDFLNGVEVSSIHHGVATAVHTGRPEHAHDDRAQLLVGLAEVCYAVST